MRITALVALAALSSPLSAQFSIVRPDVTIRGEPGFIRSLGMDSPRAVIGVTTSGSATSRDTLGVLVTSVRSGSPAEKAGIEEGNRIASVNGVSLKLAAADVGEYDAAGLMSRRLNRELNKLKPGDEVDLRVWANGQTKSIKVKTVSPEDLFETRARRRASERATLGLSIGTTGSSRDTIGVFVMSVDDGSPAAKAGVEEGSRIASINGVDVRGRRQDDEDGFFRSSTVNRVEREMAKVKPGDDVTLRVYYNGQFRNVTVKAVSAADLPRRNRAITIIGGDGFGALARKIRLP
jgi:serine protease Do